MFSKYIHSASNFLTQPVTVASNERAFSKLKLIKNYLRSSMRQEGLSNLAILYIEAGESDALNYNEPVSSSAAQIGRKVKV